VITGSASFPTELREASKNFNIKGRLLWRKVMLPGIVSYILSQEQLQPLEGLRTLVIVAEVVYSWGDKK
jgi:NitT/TauT family transport system permease protein